MSTRLPIILSPGHSLLRNRSDSEYDSSSELNRPSPRTRHLSVDVPSDGEKTRRRHPRTSLFPLHPLLASRCIALALILCLCLACFIWGATVGSTVGSEHLQSVVQRLRLGKSWVSPSAPPSFASSFHPSSLSSSPDLSPAEVEVVRLLTGSSSVPSLLPSTLSLLRSSLSLFSFTLLTLRPSIQRTLWNEYCDSFIPCPSPRSSLRHRGVHLHDREIFDALNQHSWLNILTQSFSSPPPSPEPLFHSSSHLPHLIPGELADDQEIAQRFQRELYALQHPPDCSQAKFLVLDWYHKDGGFGSWQHMRATALAVAFRAGRTLVEPPGNFSYSQAYSDCTRERGLGGCGVLLPASRCELPPDWNGSVIEEDRRLHGVWVNGTYPSMDAQFHRYEGRRILSSREIWEERDENFELHHNFHPNWNRSSDFIHLPPRLHYLQAMPECWWMRQCLAYHLRLTREAGMKVAWYVARSLRLPQPNLTVANAFRNADRQMPLHNTTQHWWLVIAAIKLEWQMWHLAPDLVYALRREVSSPYPSSLSSPFPPPPSSPTPRPFRLPLLGYTFIRHGDKGMEANLIPDTAYLHRLSTLSSQHGLHDWYIGADNLTSPSHLVSLLPSLPFNSSLHLFTSSIVDDIPLVNRTEHPLAGGFAWSASLQMTDTHREDVVWRTLVDLGIAQCSDVFFGTWSSNHPRVGYEAAGAPSDARSTAAFVSWDHIRTGIDNVEKHVHFPDCPYQ